MSFQHVRLLDLFHKYYRCNICWIIVLRTADRLKDETLVLVFSSQKARLRMTEIQKTDEIHDQVQSVKSDAQFRFLDLPGEIRNQIYE